MNNAEGASTTSMSPRKRLRSSADLEIDKNISECSSTAAPSVKRIYIPTISLHGENGNFKLADNSISHAYDMYQAVYLPQYENHLPSNDNDCNKKKTLFNWKDLNHIYEHLDKKDKESFCIEKNDQQSTNICPTDRDILKEKQSNDDRNSDTVGYCSFLIQNKDMLSKILNQLPVSALHDNTCSVSDKGREDGSNTHIACNSCPCLWDYEPCLWIFFGRNDPGSTAKQSDLQGRPEHTDSISHDGTWHYQLSGIKKWLLRPTRKLAKTLCEKIAIDSDDVSESNLIDDMIQQQITVECQEGDILIVNTRLWQHQTILPPQPQPSVSYARDFWVQRQHTEPDDCNGTIGSDRNMTNVDGLYATDDIEERTIIFRESEMPDCELHRSSVNPNCQVVQLDDGSQAVVSSRKILSGEFFCIAESSDEEEEGSFDEEELSEDDEE